jgi:uroporphyrinogen-III decarboxylase
MMTSKQRVHAALRRQPVDRVPVFMWYHPATLRALGRRLEIPPAAVPEALGDGIRQHPLEQADAAAGGGYILAASHTVPPETPLDNILAMYAAAGIGRVEIQDRAAGARGRRGAVEGGRLKGGAGGQVGLAVSASRVG